MIGPLQVDELLDRARNVHHADLALAEAEYRERLRLLQIVVALSPFTGATSAPPGHRGQPIEPVSRRLRGAIPVQRKPLTPAGTPTRPRRPAR